ncbi:hypothetical protein Q1695_008734 [Nippostrongylus brasiliensis]|nr:hypothetical protein Q1695_008734 [Nippostrongylus brasiliensis]
MNFVAICCSLVQLSAALKGTALKYFKYPRVIPANIRSGTRYYMEVDNIGGELIFKAVAMYPHNEGQEFVFGEFQEKECVTFATLDSTVGRCDYSFFLINQNFQCDLLDPKSPKFIGTYSKSRDIMYYIDDKGEKRMTTSGLLRKMRLGEIDEHLVEIFCVYTMKY